MCNERRVPAGRGGRRDIPLPGAAVHAIPHSAALLGPGSDVLGYDTERSTDHDWNRRVQIFLRQGDFENQGRAIWQTLMERVPAMFAGYPNWLAMSRGRCPRTTSLVIVVR